MELTAFIKSRETAIRERNIETVIAGYHPQVVLFDVVNDLHYQGAHAIRNRLTEWLSTLKDIIDFEVRVLEAKLEGNMAWSATLNHVVATTVQDAKLDMWWRETIVYLRDNDQWLITHTHSSVPFDPTTGNASVDLRP